MNLEKSRRLLSLDVFRGLTIAAMLVVNSPGNRTAYPWVEHAEWNGCTLADLVFPFFLFIVGVSIVFSLLSRQESVDHKSLFLQIAKRSAVIFGVGLLLNGFPYNHLESIRFPGVLQRIALCYFFSAILFLKLRIRGLVALIIGILVGYAALLTRFGDLSPEGNFAAKIDRLIFAGHMYRPEFDPEGLLSTLPAVATTLIGVLVGWGLKANVPGRQKVGACLIAGFFGLVGGRLLGFYFPINKALWTSSYVLFTAGAALILFGALYGLIELKGIRRWYFFEVFGVNGLAAYAFPLFLLKSLNRIDWTYADGTVSNLRLAFTRNVFENWTSPETASLLFALTHTLLWFFFFAYLYRRKIFIKI